VRALMVVGPGVEVKAIEGDAAIADGYFGEEGPDFGVEPIAVHAEIRRRVAVPDQAGKDGHGLRPLIDRDRSW
jgi:hypothetical protein